MQRRAMVGIGRLLGSDGGLIAQGNILRGDPVAYDVFPHDRPPEIMETWDTVKHEDVAALLALQHPGVTANVAVEGPLPFTEDERLLAQALAPHVVSAGRQSRLGQLRSAARMSSMHVQFAATWNSTGRLQTSADCPDPWLRLTPGPPEAPARVLLESIRWHALWIRGPISPDRDRGQLRTSDPMRATSSSTWIHAERPAAAWVPLGIGVVAAATRRLRKRDRSVGGGLGPKRWARTVAWAIAFATLLVVLPEVHDAYYDLRREVLRWFAR